MKTCGVLLIGLLAVVVGVPASASALAPARVHNLSDPGEHGYGFALDVNEAGDAVAVWLVGDRRIQVATREGHGRWSDPVLLTSLAKRSHFKLADVEIDADGDATVVLSSHRGTIEHARGSVKAIVRPAGGTWADPVKVATGGEMLRPARPQRRRRRHGPDDELGRVRARPRCSSRPGRPRVLWSAPVEVASGGACWAYWVDEVRDRDAGPRLLALGRQPSPSGRRLEPTGRDQRRRQRELRDGRGPTGSRHPGLGAPRPGDADRRTCAMTRLVGGVWEPDDGRHRPRYRTEPTDRDLRPDGRDDGLADRIWRRRSYGWSAGHRTVRGPRRRTCDVNPDWTLADISTNEQGDLVAAWSSAPDGAHFGGAHVARRPAGGSWTAPARVSRRAALRHQRGPRPRRPGNGRLDEVPPQAAPLARASSSRCSCAR